jgi:hypothetical protein
VRFFGLVDSLVLEALELYVTREEAERILDEVIADEPEWSAILRVEPVEIGDFNPN